MFRRRLLCAEGGLPEGHREFSAGHRERKKSARHRFGKISVKHRYSAGHRMAKLCGAHELLILQILCEAQVLLILQILCVAQDLLILKISCGAHGFTHFTNSARHRLYSFYNIVLGTKLRALG